MFVRFVWKQAVSSRSVYCVTHTVSAGWVAGHATTCSLVVKQCAVVGLLQVPLFDHLSLHWQLQLVGDVLTGIVAAG
jgi:hypothetical protein